MKFCKSFTLKLMICLFVLAWLGFVVVVVVVVVILGVGSEIKLVLFRGRDLTFVILFK